MKVKVGDTVLVEMTVAAVTSNAILVEDDPDDHEDWVRIPKSKIREVLKRPFKVGDKVTFGGGVNNFTILHIHEKQAWLGGPWNTLHDLSELRHVS